MLWRVTTGGYRKLIVRCLCLIAISGIVLLTFPMRGAAQEIDTWEQRRESWRIHLTGRARRPRHPLTLEEIVGLREVREVRQQSVAGRKVAFFVDQAFVDCNCSRTALYIVDDKARQKPRKLFEGTRLANLRWTPDGRFLTYLSGSKDGQQVARINPMVDRQELLIARFEGARIEAFEWAPDGHRLALVVRPSVDSAESTRRAIGGIVYDDERMWYSNLRNRHWIKPAAELWIYDLQRMVKYRLWQAPIPEEIPQAGISELAWAQDGSAIAVTYEVSRRDDAVNYINTEIGVITLANRMFTPLRTTAANEERPVWSPDGSSLAFFSRLDVARSALGVVDIQSGAMRYIGQGQVGIDVQRIWWYGRGSKLLFHAENPGRVRRERSGLYVAALRGTHDVSRIGDPDLHLSMCDTPVDGAIGCVVQAPDMPPDPALVNLSDGTLHRVAETNPELRDIALEPVREFRWTNKYGHEANGYLITPTNHVPGQRLPLIVVLYNFSGRFIAAAEQLTSYPARPLASHGFAVLLTNPTRSATWMGKGFARASIVDGYGVLSSLETAVHLLVRSGLVDSTKIGIMGWSHGGFWADFAITHSSLFRVASVLNNGDFNPGAYWYFGNHHHRAFYERYLDGPPYGSTLVNWLEYSPAFNAYRASAAVLMEASLDEAFLGLEMYSALRHYRVPVEFVIYPDEGHLLTQPKNRLASMRRNLDWFTYWLKGQEDDAAEKRDQFSRWRKLREQVQRSAGAE